VVLNQHTNQYHIGSPFLFPGNIKDSEAQLGYHINSEASPE